MNLWLLVALTCAGCYALKLLGYLVPARVLAAPGVRRAVELLPVALLAGLVVVQALADGQRLVVDGPRLAGVGVAAVTIWFRAPFLVVIVAAGLTAAGLRAAGI